jgi:hypothetical protein
MLVTRSFAGEVHVTALNAVIHLLEENGLQEPLYKKYEDVLKQTSTLSEELLQKEAEHYAGVINQLMYTHYDMLHKRRIFLRDHEPTVLRMANQINSKFSNHRFVVASYRVCFQIRSCGFKPGW